MNENIHITIAYCVVCMSFKIVLEKLEDNLVN